VQVSSLPNRVREWLTLASKLVHGDDLLYRFFQDALQTEPELFAKVPKMMLEAMGIWFPRSAYHDLPVLLPWVVRDAKCRGNKAKDLPDEWGSPDGRGYMRDDNSAVKGLPKSLSVKAPRIGSLSGARMGTEFVASHVWRVVHSDVLASRHALLNSFIPNLVWLPAQVAKLTDREGQVVQRTLQSMAYAIYRHAPVALHLVEVVEEAWAMIPEPEPIEVNDDDLNWFQVSAQWLTTRSNKLQEVVGALETLEEGGAITTSLRPSRYRERLPQVPAPARAALLAHLGRFVDS
jgi:hypothetical protein